MAENQLTIPEVMDINTGEIFRSADILSQDASANHVQRMKDEISKIRKGSTKYHCPICSEELAIRGGPDRTYHFRHSANPEANCPYRYTHSLSHDQIEAMKYDGAKESLQHKTIKKMIEKSLIADRHINNETILLEKRIQGQRNGDDWKKWRQPDVQAIYKQQRFVFEIQLSTTFLTVIAGRREFYSSNNALLVWIFGKGIVGHDQMRFMDRDIYFTYNRNLFYLTEETVKKSVEMAECRLMCRYEQPYIENGHITSKFCEKEIALSETSHDEKDGHQRVYYFDYDQHCAQLKEELTNQNIEPRPIQLAVNSRKDFVTPPFGSFQEYMEAKKLEDLEYTVDLIERFGITDPSINTREKFLDYWQRACMEARHTKALSIIWNVFYPELSEICQDLAEDLPIDCRNIICALLSLREGIVLGSNLANLRALENHIFSSYRSLYRHFAFGIRAYSREDVLKSLEPTSTCFKHLADYKKSKGMPGYLQNRKIDQLIVFLFPEIAN